VQSSRLSTEALAKVEAEWLATCPEPVEGSDLKNMRLPKSLCSTGLPRRLQPVGLLPPSLCELWRDKRNDERFNLGFWILVFGLIPVDPVNPV